MEPYTYLPIAVGISLFCITLFFRSKARNQPKPDVLSATSAKSAKSAKSANVKPTELLPPPKYGPIHIFFGSQTGAANNYANLLSEEGARAGFEPKVVDLNDFTPEMFKDVKLALFTMATHGEGDPTENAKKFNDYIIASERSGTEFKGLKFSVFALGNKQYQFYCAMGRRTDENLERLGAERVYKRGEGDDNENLEDDFNAWKEDIWPELIKHATISTAKENGPLASATGPAEKFNNHLPFVVTIKPDLKEFDLDNYKHENDDKEYDFQAKQYLAGASAPITLIRELRKKTDDGSTLHVEIDCATAGLTYKTAANLAVYPENRREVVERAAKLLGLNLSDVFVIEQNVSVDNKNKFKHPIPSPISVETYLTKFCDLQSAIRKKQLKDLALICDKEENKKKLEFLASIQGKAEYEVQIQSRMKGLLDIFEDFEVKPNLDQLINISTLVLPRLYTIASSSKKHPNSIHLCVSVQNDYLADGKTKVGLTSEFFVNKHQQSLKEGHFGGVRVSVRDSTFILPSDASVPIIMVGPGAGVAPFKGFVDEKAHLAQTGEENPYGEMALYFGCKGRAWDYLYEEEFNKHHAEGVLNKFYVAFSREQQQKVYVQDLIGKNKDEVSKLLFEDNGTLFICGSMAMGKSLITKMIELAASYYKIEAAEAQVKVEELEKNKKIIKELWG